MILKEAMRMKKNKEGTQVAKHKDKKSFKARLSSIIRCAPVTIWSVLFAVSYTHITLPTNSRV